jgi:hypothetical protein
MFEIRATNYSPWIPLLLTPLSPTSSVSCTRAATPTSSSLCAGDRRHAASRGPAPPLPLTAGAAVRHAAAGAGEETVAKKC